MRSRFASTQRPARCWTRRRSGSTAGSRRRCAAAAKRRPSSSTRSCPTACWVTRSGARPSSTTPPGQSEARLDAAEECAGMADHEGEDGMDGAPAESGLSVSISAPEVIEGRDVTVGLKAEGVEIRLPTNKGQDPAFGHYHLYLDIPPNVTHKHNGNSGEPTNPNDIMTTADSHTFKDLKPGTHVVTAVLFYDDPTPFSPAVVAGAR